MIEQKPTRRQQIGGAIRELGLLASLMFDPRMDPLYQQFVSRRRLRQRGIDEGKLTRPITLPGRIRELFEDFKGAMYGSNRYPIQ